LTAFIVTRIFPRNYSAILQHLQAYSISDGCVEAEMELQAEKVTQEAQTPSLSTSASSATDDDDDCSISSCIGIQVSPA
jgi:hypothetical protein